VFRNILERLRLGSVFRNILERLRLGSAFRNILERLRLGSVFRNFSERLRLGSSPTYATCLMKLQGILASDVILRMNVPVPRAQLNEPTGSPSSGSRELGGWNAQPSLASAVLANACLAQRASFAA
jgi:hypothetical protein